MSRKSYTDQDHEKLFESYTLYLWVKQFCRAGTSLKIPIKIKQQIFPTPLNPDLRFTYNVDVNKINSHTGKIGTGKKK